MLQTKPLHNFLRHTFFWAIAIGAFCSLPIFSHAQTEAASSKDDVLTEIKILTPKFRKGRLAFSYILEESKDIYVADFSSLEIKPLVATKASDSFPDWSPDGKTLVFSSTMDGNPEIYSIKSDGSQLTRLTKNSREDTEPDWSPDGTRIVFASNRVSKKVYNLYIMNANGSGTIALTNYKKPIKNSAPKWSPRGDDFIFSTNTFPPGWDLGLYSSVTGKKKALTSGSKSYLMPSWSPTASVLAFSYGLNNEADIWLQKKGKREPIRLTNLAGREYDAEWDEKGQGLFFVGELAPSSNHFGIYHINIKTKEITPVLAGPGSIRHLSWTPLPGIPPLPSPPKKQNDLE